MAPTCLFLTTRARDHSSVTRQKSRDLVIRMALWNFSFITEGGRNFWKIFFSFFFWPELAKKKCHKFYFRKFLKKMMYKNKSKKKKKNYSYVKGGNIFFWKISIFVTLWWILFIFFLKNMFFRCNFCKIYFERKII